MKLNTANLLYVYKERIPLNLRQLVLDSIPPDEFAVSGREIYLRYPNGVARSRLTNAYFDSRLGTTSTARNWKTVLKLIEWTHGGPDDGSHR